MDDANFKSLEARIAALEEDPKAYRARKAEELRREIFAEARHEATLQCLQELASRAGCSVALFLKRYEAAVRFHQDRLLRKAGGTAPSLASLIDDRPLDKIPTDPEVPRFFSTP
jgi:hypothetical protein